MISDYPELIAEVTHRTGEASVPTRAAIYTGMAETSLNRALALSDMEATTTLTLDALGEADLPADFLRMRLVKRGDHSLDSYDLHAIKIKTRYGYAIQNGKIITSFPNADIDAYYYQKLPPLVTNSTNWLLASAPDVYLHAVMHQVFVAMLDADRALAASTFLQALLTDLTRADAIKRFSNTKRQVAGISP